MLSYGVNVPIKTVEVRDIILNVFGEYFFLELQDTIENTCTLKGKPLSSSSLQCVQITMKRILDQCFVNNPEVDSRPGRLGPAVTKFDIHSKVGHFFFWPDKFSLNAQSNFCTILANSCVYEGKWQYEVQLGSKGIMQIGWALRGSKFTQEVGVGDTVDSFSYDGNRKRRWNVSTDSYGELWLTGDIISVTIDLNIGSVNYFRNGHPLGEAFSDIQLGPGKAYFPAVSLAFAENLIVNFGATPFKYPIVGYEPMQLPPSSKIGKVDQILEWLNSLLVYHDSLNHDGVITKEAITMIFVRMIFFELAPFLQDNFIIEECILKFIKKTLSNQESQNGKKTVPDISSPEIQRFFRFMDYVWLLMEEVDIKYLLERIISCLLSSYRHVAYLIDYPHQCEALCVLTALTMHGKTRKYLLQNIFFDKIRFANFLHIKPLDDDGLKDIVTCTWWPKSEASPSSSDEDVDSKEEYLESCECINQAVSGLETMQVEFIKLLLTNTDGSSTEPCSRSIFLHKFRIFINENLLPWRSLPMLHTPLPMSLCCFHRIIVAARDLWEQEVPDQPVLIPHKVFFDGSINFLNMDRLGGVLSFLLKNTKQELIEELGPEHPLFSSISDLNADPEPNFSSAIFGEFTGEAASGLASLLPVLTRFLTSATTSSDMRVSQLDQIVTVSAVVSHSSFTPLCMKNLQLGSADSHASLIELLDGAVLLYHLAAHKQLLKVSSLRNSMEDYVSCLNMTLLASSKGSTNICAWNDELHEYANILEKQICEQSRHMAWVRGVLYSDTKQSHIIWLLHVMITSVMNASATGPLYGFVPEYYLETIIQMMSVLKDYIYPSLPPEKILGHEKLFFTIEEFVCKQFDDSRIVSANSRDLIVQALAEFVSNERTLRLLEKIDVDVRCRLVQALLKSYENRAWAQNNWILVRFWQGHGFGFRCKRSPHLKTRIGPKLLSLETSIIHQSIEPCPSTIFQEHLKVLLRDETLATSFINSVLNQLNWAFSEFIGMLQEVQNLSSRSERVLIDSRQLRVCVTCFDLALALLRVLEMVAATARFVFTDLNYESSKTLLERLCQLLCQILNRVSATSGCFHYVISLEIPDLDLIDHYPILTAVVGILLALLNDELDSEIEKNHVPTVAKVILSDPSFQLCSLQFVLGNNNSDLRFPANGRKKERIFSFLSYPDDITPEEIKKVQQMIHFLSHCLQKMSVSKEIDDEDMCPICYAYPISATFKPCDHKSCRSCILHHLMNSKDCFFCKSTITDVLGADNEILHSTVNE
ncbi:E3 ubiquitin-protein ligase RNF123 [Bemisia tabaci]|uniref:E3 ubiquitin-protein ligase RNF123 n=1 Tax=Bemisia tabaci TaxID=7038 RepID=UPI003B27D419